MGSDQRPRISIVTPSLDQARKGVPGDFVSTLFEWLGWAVKRSSRPGASCQFHAVAHLVAQFASRIHRVRDFRSRSQHVYSVP